MQDLFLTIVPTVPHFLAEHSDHRLHSDGLPLTVFGPSGVKSSYWNSSAKMPWLDLSSHWLANNNLDSLDRISQDAMFYLPRNGLCPTRAKNCQIGRQGLPHSRHLSHSRPLLAYTSILRSHHERKPPCSHHGLGLTNLQRALKNLRFIQNSYYDPFYALSKKLTCDT